MAKKLRDEDLVLNIIVNGNKGKKEIGELERSIRDTSRSIKKLEKDQQALRKENKQDTEEFKALTAAINEKQKSIRLAEARITQLRQGMKLTEMSTTDLKRELLRLNAAFGAATPGTENYQKLGAQVDAVKARLAELRAGATTTGSNISNLANRFNQYFTTIAVGFASFIAFFTGIKRVVDLFAEFDDKISDVQKTTGLAKSEVKDLNEELKKIDTRTQQNDLLGLARIAGKLGITGKKDVEEFVKATDQINVALSEDLGGDVEETINQVGKLVDIFNVKDEFGIEQGLLKVGSTINSLGAASTASEEYLVEFTKRVAGVAPSAGVNIQKVLGLAATLDQLGQSAEVAGTTYAAVVPAMFTDTANFARIAGMEINSFTALLNEDANEAFIRTIEGLKGNNEGMAELVARLGDLGIDGTRATNVIGVLANNTQLLRDQQSLANQEFVKGNSITNEFNTKNQNAAAQLQKNKKELYNMTVELGERLYPAISSSVSGITMLVKVLFSLIGFLVENRKAILTVVTALIVYNATIAITNAFTKESIFLKRAEAALTKLQAYWNTIYTATLHLVSAAYFLLRGRIAAAKAEMIAFNLVTKLNPFAAILAGITAITVGLILYARNAKTAAEAQKELIDKFHEQKTKVQGLSQSLQPLLTRYDQLKQKTNLNKSEQAELHSIIQKVAEQVPSAATAIDGYGKALDINKTKVNEYIEGQKRLLQYQNKAAKAATIDEINRLANLKYGMVQLLNNMLKKGLSSEVEIANIRNGITSYASDIEALRFQLKELNGDFLNTGQKPKVNTSGKKSDELTADQAAAREKYSREAKSQLEQEQLAHEDRLKEVGLFGKKKHDLTKKDHEVLEALEKIHQQNIKNITEKSDKKDNSAKEKLKQELEQQAAYRREVTNSQKNLIDQENITHNDRLKKAGLFGKKREKLTAEELSALISLEKIHQNNLDKIDADAISKDIEEKQKAFEKELKAIRFKNSQELSEANSFQKAKGLLVGQLSAEELAKITTLEQAKKALKEQYQREEDELTRKHLEGLIGELQTAINNGDYAEIKLADKIFSEEELQVLAERLGLAKEKLAELLAGLKGKDEGDKVATSFSFEKNKADIFGLTQDDWELMFENFRNGEVGIQTMVGAANALIGVWNSYAQIAANSENRNLQQFEASTNQKKAALQKQLDSGKISQKKYTSEVAKLDQDLDRKKADLSYKQAKREKAIQIMSAIAGTASAVVGALGMKPWTPLNFALAAIVGAAGAVQLGTILSAPLPGKQEGGSLMDVTRAQDGKKFRAAYDPGKRGFVHKPTVITGEAGTEFVLNDQAVSNPTIAPFLSIIDTAQKNGTISTLNLEKELAYSSNSSRMPGRASGGFVSDQTSVPDLQGNNADSNNDLMLKLLQRNLEVSAKLSERLNKPISAQVGLLGPDGFVAKMDEYNSLQDDVNL